MLRFYDLFSVISSSWLLNHLLHSNIMLEVHSNGKLKLRIVAHLRVKVFLFWKTDRNYRVKYSKVFCILNSNWYNLILLCFLFRHICIQICIRLYQLSALTNHFQLQFPLEGQIGKETKLTFIIFMLCGALKMQIIWVYPKQCYTLYTNEDIMWPR